MRRVDIKRPGLQTTTHAAQIIGQFDRWTRLDNHADSADRAITVQWCQGTAEPAEQYVGQGCARSRFRLRHSAGKIENRRRPAARPWDDLVVALNIDTSRAFRTHAERASLIAAVTAATEHDEARWLELKSSLDLSSKEGQFAVARAILGMSNRDPDLAAQWCEGTAYVIVGADHDGCHGVTTVDHVILENGLAPYLGTGANAPRWSPEYVQVGGLDVLVVTVEASRYGDRIMALRKEFGTARAGTIFVRGQAKTEAATPGEIVMLEDRLLRGVQDPAMGLAVVGSVRAPGLVCVEDYGNSVTLSEWLSAERIEVMSGAPPAQLKTGTSMDQLFATQGLLGLGRASRESYEKEVDAYLRKCKSRLSAVVRGVACRTDSDKFRITVTNPEQATMESVRVVVEIDVAAAEMLDAPPPDSRLPRRPKYTDSSAGAGFRLRTPHLEDLRLATRSPGAVSVDRAGATWRAVWLMGDLHPQQEMHCDPVTVIPAQAATTVEVRWSATAKNRSGVATGSQQLDVVADRRVVVGHGSSFAHE